MNKNYKNMLMVAMLSLSAYNGLVLAEQTKKACIDPNGRPFAALVKNYIMSYAVFSSGIPVVSAGVIKTLGSAPLNCSMRDFKGISRDLGKGLLKTVPVTAPLAVAFHTVRKNFAE